MVHLVNAIILTGKFPKILKLSRISPLNKPDKDPNLLSSYRPINNLSSVEKVIETYILSHLIPFLNTNNIIDDNHHGGRAKHATTSALAQISHRICTGYEKKT